MNLYDPTTFDEVCALLAKHQRGLTPEQTLNRLFQKHLNGHKKHIANGAPTLTRDNTTVGKEFWNTNSLRALMPRPKEKNRKPHTDEFPVVIVRYLGTNCLIDGGTRANYWYYEGDAREHQAAVLTVAT
jgi:hypothetical protein